jgi:transposase
LDALAPGRTRSPGTRPIRPAATAPTCANAISRWSSRRSRTRPPIGRRRAPEAAAVGHDADLYKERNTVERLINKLKAWRGIATRSDKTPDSYLAGLHLRASMIWIKDLTRGAS